MGPGRSVADLLGAYSVTEAPQRTASERPSVPVDSVRWDAVVPRVFYIYIHTYMSIVATVHPAVGGQGKEFSQYQCPGTKPSSALSQNGRPGSAKDFGLGACVCMVY